MACFARGGSGWVMRNDHDVAARHVLKHFISEGRLTGLVTATFPDGQVVNLSGGLAWTVTKPGATGDRPTKMDAVVVRLPPGQQLPAPPVPCALATSGADGSVADAECVSVQQGAACTLLHHPRSNNNVVVTPRGEVLSVVAGGGQPWCVTHDLDSDQGSSGGLIIDAQCRAATIHCARENGNVKHAVLVSALHLGLGQASPWLGVPPVEHGRGVEYGLPPRCSVFVGRVDALAALTRAVRADGRVVVVSTGLPGVGKSTMVSEWAHQASLSREYGAVIWLRADTLENLCDDLVGLGEKLRMPLRVVANRPMIDRAAFVVRQLVNGSFVSGVALLVFDNADNFAIVRDLAPAGRDCRVVFTARDRLTYSFHCVLPLSPFAAGESMELLRAIIRRPVEGNEIAAAEALCEEVGHLPLAVEQLALFAKESDASLTSVLFHVQQSAASAGPLESITVAAYARRASVVGALRLVQRQLSVSGRRVLHRLALLAPERVPRELLGPLSEEAIAELSSLAMVTYPAPGLVSAHRLVLRVALGELGDDQTERLRAPGEVVAALAKHLRDFDRDKSTTWGPMRAILPHAEAFSRLKVMTSVWEDAF